MFNSMGTKRDLSFNTEKINIVLLLLSQSWLFVIIFIAMWGDTSRIISSLIGAFILAPIVMITALRRHFKSDQGLNSKNFTAFVIIILIGLVFLFLDFIGFVALGFIINAFFLLMWGMVPYSSTIEVQDLDNGTELTFSTQRLFLHDINRKIGIANGTEIEIIKPDGYRGPGSRGFWYRYIKLGQGIYSKIFPLVPFNEKGIDLARKAYIMFPNNKLIISENILSQGTLFSKFTYPPVLWSRSSDQVNSNNLIADFNLITSQNSFRKKSMVSRYRLFGGFIVGIIYALIFLIGLLFSFVMIFGSIIHSMYPLTIFGFIVLCTILYFYGYIFINSMVHPVIQLFGHPLMFEDKGESIFCYQLGKIKAQKIKIPVELNSHIGVEGGICFLRLYLDSQHEFQFRFGHVEGFENGIVKVHS